VNKFTEDYFRLITEDYAGINLTRITDFDSFKALQIEDSIIPFEKSKVFQKEISEKGLMVDIGFGGGFPILPMAKYLPETQFIGIETRNKKCTVVADMAKKLGLKNTKFQHSRIENVLLDVPCVCTLKAVGKVDQFLEKINATASIVVFFYKARNFYEIEKEALKKIAKDWETIEEIDIDVPGTERRILIGFKPKNVPCGTNNHKNLVKLSNIK
jgi:16S rRNA (guanine527-N7)-methyltransferase